MRNRPDCGARHVNRRYLLALLVIILAFNYVDRLALGLVAQDIKRDLSLSDTQLGLLGGLSFALFYAVMGVPIARWADRSNRSRIIAVCAALWSVAVVLCGFATSFLQLVLIRIGVGVGEAGCKPPALSLLSDYFSRAERPGAIAQYELGWPLALTVGYFTAGWINQVYGWRVTFIALGLPGLLLAGVASLTIRDPRAAITAKAPTGEDADEHVQPKAGLFAILVMLWRNSAFRHLGFALAVTSFFTFGIMQWQPAFFARSYGLGSAQIGTWLAGVYGVAAIPGTLLGGVWATRFASRNEQLQFRAVAAIYALFAALSAAIYLTRSYQWAFILYAIAVFGGAAGNGPLFAATQTLVAPGVRATAAAIILFFNNLIGLGLGPLAVGMLSDALRPRFGSESLRYSLVLFTPGYLWAAWHLWQASRTVNQAASDAAGPELSA